MEIYCLNSFDEKNVLDVCQVMNNGRSQSKGLPWACARTAAHAHEVAHSYRHTMHNKKLTSVDIYTSDLHRETELKQNG